MDPNKYSPNGDISNSCNQNGRFGYGNAPKQRYGESSLSDCPQRNSYAQPGNDGQTQNSNGYGQQAYEVTQTRTTVSTTFPKRGAAAAGSQWQTWFQAVMYVQIVLQVIACLVMFACALVLGLVVGHAAQGSPSLVLEMVSMIWNFFDAFYQAILLLIIFSLIWTLFIIFCEVQLLKMKQWAYTTLLVIYTLDILLGISSIDLNSFDVWRIASFLLIVIRPCFIMGSIIGGIATTNSKNPFK